MVYGFLLAPLLVSLGGAAAPPQHELGPRDLGAGVNAFRAGNYKNAIATLRRVRAIKLRNADYAAFFLAEALTATNAHSAAISVYQDVIRGPASRFTAAAEWRLGDALWQLKRTNEAKVQYDRLLAKKVPDGDPAQAWMRIGTVALTNKDREAAIAAFEKVAVSFAKHPAAAEANDQLRRLRPSGSANPATGTTLSPVQRISRARALSDRHQWSDAISDLQTLTDGMTPDVAALRDFVLGQAKYRSRSDYAGASKLLYGAVPLLPEKEAIWAAFHGARALSRADHDDEAIEGYLKFVGSYPKSTFASEAQFLAGWLHFNQGRFAQSAPALTATMKRFGRTPFAVDAAWYLFLGSYFANDFTAALANLAVFDDTTQGGRSNRMWPADRVKYWRARAIWFVRSEKSPDLGTRCTRAGTGGRPACSTSPANTRCKISALETYSTR